MTPNTVDNPLVRASSTCPLCNFAKAPGLVACWPCYNAHDLRNGNPEAEAQIANREQRLHNVRAVITVRGRLFA